MQTPSVFSKPENVTFGHLSYDGFLNYKNNLFDIVKHGYLSSSLYSKLCNPSFLQKLYQEKDPGYMSYLNEFYDRFHDFDVIVMNSGVDLVHPEFLIKHFPNALKCLHFIDDPHLTYSYCLPYAWAFDCATYVSPSYSDQFTMSELLSHSGLKEHRWTPHCITNNLNPPFTVEQLETQLLERENKAVYVGAFYTSKTKRLIEIKSQLRTNLDIFGRQPFGGFIFPIMSSLSGFPSSYRVKQLSELQRERLYEKYAVGLNMHLSHPARETGNARLYELAYRGVAQVVDSSEHSAVSQIFKPEEEILLYENTSECVAQVMRLLANKDLRVSIALQAYKRAIKEYSYQRVLNDTCEWFKQLLQAKAF